ncbi:MAG TPA: phytase [Sedimentisphaerales bacterium]|nr:phytase [Sedimentisphaerales bacterium]
MSAKAIVILSVLLGGFCFLESAFAEVFQVMATVETEPVSHSGDSADDAKVWVHPTDPNQSVIIGTDKHDTEGGLAVYDLSGRLTFFAKDGKMNNVDVRYNFPLGDNKVDIIAVSNRSNNSIAVYTIDPGSRELTNVAARTISIGLTKIYGFCLYQSWRTGKYYAFVNDKNGEVEQWELFDNLSGKVDAVRVRSFDVGTQTEGMVADDQLGHLYVGEEDVGIWKYGAEPTDPADNANRVLVDGTNTDTGGHLVADVEGLMIYYAQGADGYLIASSQGEDHPSHILANTFAVYRRDVENEYVMSFRVVENSALGIDGVSNTDGIGVANVFLGSAFPQGVFVAQDGHNSGGNQNFKLVPWESIATAITPSLMIDTGWNPRLWWELVPVLHAEPEITLGTSNTISWDYVPGAMEYCAECAEDAEFTSIIYNSGWITETNCEFSGLELGKRYWYSVKARNIAGIETDWSNVESSLQGTLADAVDIMLDPESLKNKNMKNALLNKIDAVQQMVEEGNYTGALSKLENDILAKTNGCGETGEPDKNDWIITCEEQSEVYRLVIETIEHVMGLMQ